MTVNKDKAGGRRPQALAALTRLAPLRPPAINVTRIFPKGGATMSTAKKTLYAAIGAGSTAIEKARELPKRVITLPTTLTERVGSLRKIDLRELPKTVQGKVTTAPARASDLVEEAKKFADTATERFVKAYGDLSKRGEKVAKKVRKQAPAKRAPKAKATTPKAKTAPAAAKKAAEPVLETAVEAVDKTAEATA